MTSPPPFLAQHLPLDKATASRPHITVTWAQSLDSKIAGVGGKRVILSGSESMLMTHWMRTMHDAIMIGINTLILDDPRLQNFLSDSRINTSLTLPTRTRSKSPSRLAQLATSPTTDSRPSSPFPPSARLLTEYLTKPSQRSISLHQPWIICSDQVSHFKIRALEGSGARIIPVKVDESGRIPPSSLPTVLGELGLRSVMIEGGSKVLSQFLSCKDKREDGSPLVDSVVVTVAPTFIGDGVGVVPEGEDKGLPPLRTLHTETMGKDAVMVCAIDI